MYIKPDFILVSVKVKDVFASYVETGCAEDWGETWYLTNPCASDPDREWIEGTMTGLGFGHQCYSTQNK